MSVVLAVDGGNSKTDLVAFAPDGHVVARVRGPGSGGGPAHVARVVRDLAAQAAIPRSEVATLVAGVAGLDFPDDAVAFEGALALEFPEARIHALGDAAAMLSVHDLGEHVLVMVCGAGFNVVARGPRGIATVPALDWVSGDFGGADAIGREVVRLAYRAGDGRGEPTSLREAVLAQAGVDDMVALARDIRDGAVTPGELAPLATREAQAGDPVASALVQRAIDEAVGLAGEVTGRAWGDVPVVPGSTALLVGGMFSSPQFHDGVVAGLEELGFDAERFPHDAVAGIVREACATAGLPAAVARRVIDSLAASAVGARQEEA